MNKTRLEIAKPEILNFFRESPTKIFAYREIVSILDLNKKYWKLAQNISVWKFIEFLLQSKILKKITLEFPYKKIVRYLTYDKISIFQLLLSIDKNSYYTHSTSLFLHGLTKTPPNIIYLNIEQSQHKTTQQKLMQSNIDLAFSRKQKVSNNITTFQNHKICLLNGKFTKKLGVTTIEKPKIGKIFLTNIERTLIDITVRPVYGRGVNNVLNIYKKVKNLISFEKLSETLTKLDYIYPYHQAIGFYLQKSKVYKETQIDIFKKPGLNYDFYLDYNMSKTKYSKEWRIYYPFNLD